MRQPRDDAVRRSAVDVRRSFIVEAPAGSGKTALLAQRFLALLAQVDAPEAVVAITFTRKAAAEMRQRILDALSIVAEGGDGGHYHELAALASVRDRDRGWQLLDHPARLQIHTIDALASRLARRVPLLSGHSGATEIVEDMSEVYREAAQRCLLELSAPAHWSADVASLLRHLDNDWGRVERLLMAMLPRRDQWLRLTGAGAQLDALKQLLSQAVRDELEYLYQTVDAKWWLELTTLAREAAEELATTAPESPFLAFRALPSQWSLDAEEAHFFRLLAQWLLTKEGKPRQRFTRAHGRPQKSATRTRFDARMDDLRKHIATTPGLLSRLNAIRWLPTTTYTAPQLQVLAALLSVLKLAAAQLKVCMAERSQVDFIDVAQAARIALGRLDNPTELSLVLDHHIEHLLIDEFQDTSFSQYEFLELLTGGWQDGDGRSLFFVGDPMQSIYRFREADVRLFTRTVARARFGSVPLTHLRLSTNFRSAPAVIDWLNDALPPIYAAATFCPSPLARYTAMREHIAGSGVEVHITTDAEAEAQAVVGIIAAARARDPNARIGVLVRSRAQLGVLPQTLLAAGFSIAATEIDTWLKSPVINDLLALTRAVMHDFDRTAWLACLAAPWCGADLETITTIVNGHPAHASMWEMIELALEQPRIAADAARRVQHFYACLNHARAQRYRHRLGAVVEEAWAALGGPQCLRTPAEVDHARYFFTHLRGLEKDQLRLLPATLEARFASTYMPPPPASSGAIEIMTMHRAKGLEFDTVVLPGLAHGTRPDLQPLLAWFEYHGRDGADGTLLAPIPAPGDDGDDIFRFVCDLNKREQDAEDYRLLYVALTRARDCLHLMVSPQYGEDGVRAPRRKSFQHILWPVVAPAVPAVAPLATPASATLGEVGTSRYRIASALLPQAPTTSLASATELTPRTVEYDWASATARHVGTVTHQLLHVISLAASTPLPRALPARYARSTERRLRGLGVAATAVNTAAERVKRAVDQVLSSERGRWILAPEHRDAHSEYRLSAVAQDGFVNVIIDRTFIDAAQQRWIIDFKTGTHLGGALEDFLDSELERYRPQLQRYASVFYAIDPRPIMLGLYYPLIGGWRAWAFDTTSLQRTDRLRDSATRRPPR